MCDFRYRSHASRVLGYSGLKCNAGYLIVSIAEKRGVSKVAFVAICPMDPPCTTVGQGPEYDGSTRRGVMIYVASGSFLSLTVIS